MKIGLSFAFEMKWFYSIYFINSYFENLNSFYVSEELLLS